MNKKGFTLIELLAVILILGIISLIAIPTVNSILKQSKEDANKRSIETYFQAANDFYSKSLLNSDLYDKLGENVIDDLDISKGTATGYISVDNDGLVEFALVLNNSCYIKEKDQDIKDMTVSKDVTNCNLSYVLEDTCYKYSVTGKDATITEYKCTDKKITIPSSIEGNTVTGIDDYVFSMKDMETITIPNTITSIGDGAFGGNVNLTSIVLDSENKNYIMDNGILFNKDKTSLEVVTNKTLSTYVIPSSVENISAGAFALLFSLTELTIPDTVKTIGKLAFYGCMNLNADKLHITRSVYNNFDVSLADFNKQEYAAAGYYGADFVSENIVLSGGKANFYIKEKQDKTSSVKYTNGELFANSITGYGTYSTRMKAVKNSGVVTTFFIYAQNMLDNTADEIDIEILGNNTSKVQFNIWKDGVSQGEHDYVLGFDASQDYHDYSFTWTKDYIAWSVDNNEVYRLTSSQIKIPTRATHIVLNTWNAIDIKVMNDWTGKYDGKVPLMSSYDYVKYEPLK